MTTTLPDTIREVMNLSSTVQLSHPACIGSGLDRAVFRIGDKVYKIQHDYCMRDSNWRDYKWSMLYHRGEIPEWPEDWAIPLYDMIDGVLITDFIDGVTWTEHLRQEDPFRSDWGIMTNSIKKFGLFDAFGHNVLVDSAGIHWFIDMGHEEI